jgi:hypothetical protein
MNLKNLTNRLRELSARLTEARQVEDQDLIDELEAEIADVEEQIEVVTEQEYDDHHNKDWN